MYFSDNFTGVNGKNRWQKHFISQIVDMMLTSDCYEKGTYVRILSLTYASRITVTGVKMFSF